MKFLRTGSVSRARWAAVGAAIAVSLGVGGVAITHAVVSSGERDIFVPISPCRLFDYRPAPDQVGSRGTPLQPGETYTQAVRGANGNCNIPADATAVAMNVTAVGGTAGSFLTIWPSDVAPKPLASNLNWVPGSPPTPNKVDVKVSVADGKINLFNLTGTVSVLADVVGYYADHNFDDRYYTKAEVDGKFATSVKLTLSTAGFTADNGAVDWTNGCVRQDLAPFTVRTGVQLPAGATITRISGYLIDSNATNGTLRLVRVTGVNTALATATTAGTPGLHQLVATLGTPELVSAGEYFFIEYIGGDGTGSQQACGAEIDYTIPAGLSLQGTDGNQDDPAGVPSGSE